MNDTKPKILTYLLVPTSYLDNLKYPLFQFHPWLIYLFQSLIYKFLPIEFQ